MKGDVLKMDWMLKRLTSVAAKQRFMRDNIEMRVEGLGVMFAEDFSITWSVKSKQRQVKDLANHLKKIMKAEVKMDKPSKPQVTLPTRRATTIIGTLTDEVKVVNAQYFAEVSKFEEDTERLRQEMEAKGEGSMHAMLQPDTRPTPEEIVRDYKGRVDVIRASTVSDLLGQVL